MKKSTVNLSLKILQKTKFKKT